MASKFFNLARMTTATTGTGTITLGSAVSGFLSFSQAGISDGDTVSYAIHDGANSEVGRGVYSASGGTLTRSVIKSTNSDALISLSGTAQVIITPLAEDLALNYSHQPHDKWRVLITDVASSGTYADLLQASFYDRSSTFIDVKNHGTVIDGGSYGGFPVSRLFDQIGTNEWASAGGVTSSSPASFGFYMATGNVDVGSFTLKSNASYMGRAPVTLALQFSDDGGASWITYQTWTGLSWTSGETKTFTCNTTSAQAYSTLVSVASSYLKNLTDTNITPGSAIDKAILKFDNASGKWKAGGLPGEANFTAPPTVAGGTWTQQNFDGTYTHFEDVSDGGIPRARLRDGPFAYGNNHKLRAALVAVPGTHWQVIMRLRQLSNQASQYGAVGFVARDSASGTSVIIGNFPYGGGQGYVALSSDTGFNTSSAMGEMQLWRDIWFKFSWDGTTCKMYTSTDGNYFSQWHTQSNAKFWGLTNNATHIGFGFDVNNSNSTEQELALECLSWSATALA